VGFDRDFLPRLRGVLRERPERFPTSMHTLHVRKEAREVNLDLWGKDIERGVEVTPVRSLVQPADDLDVFLRHRLFSIPQAANRAHEPPRRTHGSAGPALSWSATLTTSVCS